MNYSQKFYLGTGLNMACVVAAILLLATPSLPSTAVLALVPFATAGFILQVSSVRAGLRELKRLDVEFKRNFQATSEKLLRDQKGE